MFQDVYRLKLELAQIASSDLVKSCSPQTQALIKETIGRLNEISYHLKVKESCLNH